MIAPDHPDAERVFKAAWHAADEKGEEGRVLAGLRALAEQHPETGRFEGDLLAELDHDPAARKPFRVRVWVWTYSYTKEAFGWYGARGSILDEPEHVKEFRRLYKAVEYLYKVRAQAESDRLFSVVKATTESRREVLA